MLGAFEPQSFRDSYAVCQMARNFCGCTGVSTAMMRFLLSLALPAAMWACSCSPSDGPPCIAAWKASVVFAGTVVELTRDTRQPDSRGIVQVNGFLGTHAIFEVAEAFIGMAGRGKQVEIRTGMGGGDCGYRFERGQGYLVYAYENKDGLLVASICSRTATVDRVQADLTYLRSLPNSGQFGYIFGVSGNGEGAGRIDQALRMWVPSGIPGATVTLNGPGKSERLVTGEDGSFQFDHLSPGKYNVAVAKDGYILTGVSAALDVHAGGCAYAWETLVVDRRLVGKVIGADGFPAANIRVELVPMRPTEQNQLPFPIAETTTGSDGAYELRNIRSGEYYLGINLARTPSKEMPYTRYFYPGTEDPSHAGVVFVEEEPGVSTYQFSLPAPQKERQVAGFVYWPDGQPAEKVGIFLEDIRWQWRTNAILATTDAKGHFEISAFDRTAYRIHAVTMGRVTNETVSAEPMPLDPGTDLSKPLQLILTRKGHSATELTGKGLERWHAGLGL
jgi:hypothetical protein